MSIILSPNMYAGRRAPIRVVVLHTMEVDETSSVAESVGRAFANPARKASAHVGVDTDSTCRYVADQDTAFAAPGINADGLQLEMAGRAGQTTGQWTDPGSKAILERAAQQTATWCRAYGIPAIRLTDAQLAAGKRGIVDHWAGTRVYKLSTHVDVGKTFPWAWFLARVNVLLKGQVTRPQTKPVKAPQTRIRLAVDGAFGPRTKARLQQWAGAPVDSVLVAGDWKAVQRKVGRLVVDGDPGIKTWKAIQRLVGVDQDGEPGSVTYRALQFWLNVH